MFRSPYLRGQIRERTSHLVIDNYHKSTTTTQPVQIHIYGRIKEIFPGRNTYLGFSCKTSSDGKITSTPSLLSDLAHQFDHKRLMCHLGNSPLISSSN